jgi:hypothetical protein
VENPPARRMRANGIRNILSRNGKEMRGIAGRDAVIRNAQRRGTF